MQPATARGYVTAMYLLGFRGAELSGLLPTEVRELCPTWVAALTSTERDTRARWLASGLRELRTELEARGPAL